MKYNIDLPAHDVQACHHVPEGEEGTARVQVRRLQPFCPNPKCFFLLKIETLFLYYLMETLALR